MYDVIERRLRNCDTFLLWHVIARRKASFQTKGLNLWKKDLENFLLTRDKNDFLGFLDLWSYQVKAVDQVGYCLHVAVFNTFRFVSLWMEFRHDTRIVYNVHVVLGLVTILECCDYNCHVLSVNCDMQTWNRVSCARKLAVRDIVSTVC